MERLITPTLRRLPVISISRRFTSISAAAASTVSSSTTSAGQFRSEDNGRPNRQVKANGASDDASVRLWSALEESELPSSSSNMKSISPSINPPSEEADEVKFNFERATTIADLDRRWREFRSNNDLDFPAVLRRSLAISRVVSTPTQSQRAIGAFFRVLNNPKATKEEIQSALNATCETLLRLDGGSRVLDLISLVRKQKGHEVLNKRTYALAIAASLALGGRPSSTREALSKRDLVDQQQQEQPDSKVSRRQMEAMDEVSESALKSSLRYFKSLFNSFSSSSGDSNETQKQATTNTNEMDFNNHANQEATESENTWSTFAVLDMMKRDFSEFNHKDANLTQDLFDDVLVLSPSKASQIAEAMQSSGFSPSRTSFLAMLHGAMKAADASKALSLLNEMHSNGVQRSETHYIATATALARRSQKERFRAGVPHPIRPWYFTALLEEYEKDFSASKIINGEFANALTIGMCAIRLGDQELIPALEDLTMKLKEKQARISGEGFGSLLTRLSVTHGEENARRILEWMKQVQATRDKHVNNGFLCFYGECLVKNSRAIRRLENLKANESVIAKKKRESELILNLSERLCAEMLQKNITRLPRTSALLQRRISSSKSLDENEFSNLINAFEVPSEEQLRVKPTLDQRTFELLARSYVYSSHGEVLEELITSLAKDAPKWVDPSPFYVLLVEAFGLAGKVDKAVEIVAEIQSQGMEITADLVEALAADVFVRNGRVGEGLAHALGLCRTYKVSPYPSTALKLLKGARKDGDEEEEERVLAFIKEFGLEGELARKTLSSSNASNNQRK